MKLSDSTLSAADQLALSHPCVKELREFYDFVTGNQVYESYVARMVTLNTFNSNLIENPVNIISVKELSLTEGGVDEKEVNKQDKQVDRVVRYLVVQPDLIKGTEELRAKLTNSELEDLKSDKRLKPSNDLAF